MKAYSEYKEINARWFNKIPVSWDVIRAKWLFSNERERSEEDDQQLAASQKHGIIPQKRMIELNNANVMLALKGTNNFKKVKRNDFVISLRSFEGGIEHSNYDGCISPAYTVLRRKTNGIDPKYFRYVFKCKPFIEALNSTSEGIRDGKNITYDEFGGLLLGLPTEREQIAIANFLDHETARIDKLIAEKQIFIDLLNEKRQALISHIVTKGLNPDVKMKDSGIEWIGEIPEHWSISKVGFYCKIINGTTPSKLKEEYWNSNDISWLSSGAVNQYYVTEASEYISYLALKQCSVHLLPTGTLIIAMIGQGKTRGMSAITRIETTINQNIAAVLPYKQVSSDYLHFVFQASYKALRDVGRGANQAALNCDLISKFKIPIPTLDEQLEISLYIKKQLLNIDLLIREVENSIGYLKEHRMTLISSVVTGKIDIKDYKEKSYE